MVLPAGGRRERRTQERERELAEDLEAAAYVERHVVSLDPLHPERFQRELDRIQTTIRRRDLAWGRVLTRQGAILFAYGPIAPRKSTGGEVIADYLDRHTALQAAFEHVDPERRRAIELSRSPARTEARKARKERDGGKQKRIWISYSKPPEVVREMLRARGVHSQMNDDQTLLMFRLPKWGLLRRSLFLGKCEWEATARTA
jgi:hypothetical protein